MSAHAEFLRAATNNAELASQIKSDFRKTPLSAKDRQMLEYVDKLTRFPWMIREGDVQSLRQAGFGDTEILHIVLGTAHFNYLNRMADGIGIWFEYQSDLPRFEPPSEKGGAQLQPGSVTDPLPRGASSSVAWVQCSPAPPEGPPESGPVNLFRVMAGIEGVLPLAREWRNHQLRPTVGVDARTRGRLALYASGLNYCEYSSYWFRQSLSQMGESSHSLELLSQGKQPENDSDLEQILYEHVLRLIWELWKTRESHINDLRSAALDDLGILQLTMLVSYVSFENRVALGLGVVPELG